MTQLKATKTVFTVGEFLDWQRAGTLDLKPVFQRNAVWKSRAKSFLIDTVVRGLPIPIVFLRKIQDLDTLRSRHEVVDGQQRLRTLFSFIDPTVLPDFNSDRDAFVVTKSHHPDIAGKSFRQLPQVVQTDILGYEISTHVFPPTTSDDVVLRIFARINSTGSDLNPQELRNARFFGAFKTLAYELAFQHLAEWRAWSLFSDDDLARMEEVEAVSEYLIAMMNGVDAKSQPRIDAHYQQYEDDLTKAEMLETKFNTTMEALGEAAGDLIGNTSLRRPPLFYSLFTACYDHLYGLASDYKSRRRAKRLPSDFRKALEALDAKIVGRALPDKVQDAIDRATADRARRTTRQQYIMKALHPEPAG